MKAKKDFIEPTLSLLGSVEEITLQASDNNNSNNGKALQIEDGESGTIGRGGDLTSG